MTQFPEIGRYQLLKRIAAGGMGEVFLARQRSSVEGFVRLFAIKVLLQSYSTNIKFVNMFIDEARVAAKLHHRNIVQVTDIDRHGDQYYLVMEYIRGQNLRELLGDGSIPGPSLFAPRLGAEILADIAGALGAVHDAGLIHRDISPNNIMVSDSGVPKLIDFGVARAVSNASLTTPGTLKGKFGYMAPEYVRGHEYDHRADIFSLGVVMWETFARRRLFRGTSAAEQLHHLLELQVPSLDQVVPDFPSELADIVALALQRDPNARFPTAAALANALTETAASLPASKDPTLAIWLERRLGARIAERKRIDEAFIAMPSNAEIPTFDDPPMSPGSAPGTYGVYEVAGSLAKTTRPSIPSMMTPSASGRVLNEFAPRVEGTAGTSVRQSVGEVHSGDKPSAPPSRWRWIAVGVASALAVVVAVSWFQLRTRPPAVPATTAIPASNRSDLAEVHRRRGLEALADKDYERARREFAGAINHGGASADLVDLLRLATELEAAAAAKVVIAAPLVDDKVEKAAVSQPPKDVKTELPAPVRRKSDPITRREPRKVAAKTKPADTTTDLVTTPQPPVPVEVPKPPVVEEKPKLGDLIVTSTPPKLRVRVDGAMMGETMLRVPLEIGTHRVEVLKDDRVVRAETVTIREQDQTFVYVEAPAPIVAPERPPVPSQPPATKPPIARSTALGELEVMSPNVVGEIYVDGVAHGWAPRVIKNVPVGRVHVEIRVDGVTRRSKHVSVQPSKRTLMRFD